LFFYRLPIFEPKNYAINSMEYDQGRNQPAPSLASIIPGLIKPYLSTIFVQGYPEKAVHL
jgi:hypothetical protein